MKKKLISCMLVSTMAISLLAGCGSSKKEEGSASVEDENTLTVWAWDQSFNIYAMKEAEKIYQKDHPDFKLKIVETPWDDMQTQLGTIVGANNYSQLPDICLMQDFAYQKYVTTYPDLYKDLSDSNIDFSQFAQGKLAASTVDGKHYGVPFDNGAEVACYRTDVLEEAGYSVDDLTDIDWDKFIEIGSDVYDKTGYSLLSVQAGSADLIYQMLQSAGFGTWNEDGTPNIAGNDNIKQCIEIYQEMSEKHVLSIVNSWDEYVATFTSGKTAGVINGCWILASVQTAEDQSGKWGIANLPSVDGIQGAGNYASSGGSSWMITSNCKDVDGAVKMLTTILGGELSDTFYQDILLDSNYIAGYLPTAGNAEIYNTPDEFFNGETIYAELGQFATKIPKSNTSYAYDETLDAVATALTNILNGADIQSELDAAQSTVDFITGK